VLALLANHTSSHIGELRYLIARTTNQRFDWLETTPSSETGFPTAGVTSVQAVVN
jgi:hypothetical protein